MNRYLTEKPKDAFYPGQKWFKKDRRFKNPNYMIIDRLHRQYYWWVYLYNPLNGDRYEGKGLISEWDLMEKYRP